MRYVFIESEAPIEHWGFVEVMGKTVLDLGCAYFGADSEKTPTFFLENGAAYVIGVDTTLSGLENITDPNIVLIQMTIESPDEIAKMYERFEPDVVKCDIEGAEIHLLYLPDGIFQQPSQYAIEVHSDELDEAFTNKLRSCGYRIKTVGDILDAAGCKVLHAVR